MEQSELAITVNADSKLAKEKKALGLVEVAVSVGLLPAILEIDGSLETKKDYNVAVLSAVLENAKSVTVSGPQDKEGYERAKKVLHGLSKLNGRKDKWVKMVKAEADAYRTMVISYDKALTDIIDKAKNFVKAEIDKADAEMQRIQQEQERKEIERFNKRVAGFISLGMEQTDKGVIVPGKPEMLIANDMLRLSTGEALRSMLAAFQPQLDRANQRKEFIEHRAKEIEALGGSFSFDGMLSFGEGKTREVIARQSLYMYDEERYDDILAKLKEWVKKGPGPVVMVTEPQVITVLNDNPEQKFLNDADRVRNVLLSIKQAEAVAMDSEIAKHGMAHFAPKIKELCIYLNKGLEALEKELRT